MTTTPAAYIRISSDRGGGRVSPDRQWEMIRDYCHRLGLGEPTRYADLDWSGSTAARPAWAALQTALRSRQTRTLVAYDQDRLFRDEEEASRFLKLARRLKLAVHFVTSGPLDLASADAATMFSIKAVFDAHLSRKTSERVRAWAAHKRSRGEKTGGLVPYGYDLAPDGRTLVPNPREQAVVAMVCELAVAGRSYRWIASYLQQQGVVTKTGLAWWGHKTVEKLVRAGQEALPKGGRVS